MGKEFIGLQYDCIPPDRSVILTSATTLKLFYESNNDTTSYSINRMNLFDVLGVFLGWVQLFSLFLYYVFSFLNNFNIKLQISRALFTNPEITESKVSFLFFLKIVFIYFLDLFNCKGCRKHLREKNIMQK
jgi:hypothetical protein